MAPDAGSGYQLHAKVTAATAAQVSWFTAISELTGGRIWREETALCIQRRIPHTEVTILFPARLEAAAVERILAWCVDNDVRSVGCWTSGLGDDERVREVLEPHQFDEGWQPHWMCRKLPLGVDPDPRVREVTEVPEYDEYGQALLKLTRVGPRRRRSWHFVARDEKGELTGLIWLHLTDMAPGVGA